MGVNWLGFDEASARIDVLAVPADRRFDGFGGRGVVARRELFDVVYGGDAFCMFVGARGLAVGGLGTRCCITVSDRNRVGDVDAMDFFGFGRLLDLLVVKSERYFEPGAVNVEVLLGNRGLVGADVDALADLFKVVLCVDEQAFTFGLMQNCC